MSWSHNSGFIFFKTNKKCSSLFVSSPFVNLSRPLYLHSRHTFWMNGHLSECNGRHNLVGISWRVPTLSDNHCEPTLLGLYGLQYTFCWSLYSSIWFFCSIFLQKIKVAVLSKMLLCTRSASEQFSRDFAIFHRNHFSPLFTSQHIPNMANSENKLSERSFLCPI